MSISEQKGSAALAGRLTAFGGVVGVLCIHGLGPVAAVALCLLAAFVLAKV
jgi:hypothetical protein